MHQFNEEYAKLLDIGAIRRNSEVKVSLKWQKAQNDLLLAEGILKISVEDSLRKALKYPKNATFFDWVIVCSYYSIFHAAQALLGMKRIKIVDRLHHATLIAFAKQFIINHELADELFTIYEDTEKKAHDLLEIIELEKDKRGQFQYHRLSRNNLSPAMESVKNARTFLEAVNKVLEKKKLI